MGEKRFAQNQRKIYYPIGIIPYTPQAANMTTLAVWGFVVDIYAILSNFLTFFIVNLSFFCQKM